MQAISIREGIILRCQDERKFTLLDKYAGKVETLILQRIRYRLSVGCMVQYRISRQGARCVAQDVQLIDMLAYTAYPDFVFFHHVLELCYFFLPWECHTREMYEVVALLYISPGLVKTRTHKLMFLCHFFYIIGIYPRGEAHEKADFFSLISQPLDSKLSMSLHQDTREYLCEWIQACMRLCPQYTMIKTGDVAKQLV